MRLLVQSRDGNELSRLKAKLDNKGVPVFISAEHSFGKVKMAVPGLWVCLDKQFNDAVAVLQNDSHEVAEPVDVKEFYSLLSHAQEEPIKAMGIDVTKILNLLVGVLATGLLIALIVKVI